MWWLQLREDGSSSGIYLGFDHYGEGWMTQLLGFGTDAVTCLHFRYSVENDQIAIQLDVDEVAVYYFGFVENPKRLWVQAIDSPMRHYAGYMLFTDDDPCAP